MVRSTLTRHPTDRPAEYRRSEVIAALSYALDLTQGQPGGHSVRSCLLGMAVATRLGLDDEALGNLYYAILLKDAGCSSSAARMSEIFGGADEIELKRAGKLVDFTRPSEALRFLREQVGTADSRIARAREMVAAVLEHVRSGGEVVSARCERGAQIVSRLGFPGDCAAAVHSLYERWDGRGRPRGLAREEIPLLARVAALAQHVDFFLTAGGREAALEMARGRRGTWFDPQVVDAFLAVGERDELWITIESADRLASLAAHEPREVARTLSDDDLDVIAVAFADVIDAKSPFTANHSRGVARAALAIGRRLGCTSRELRSLNRAALLHDIGKLGVPNAILDKPGPLTDDERRIVMRHPRHTEEILARVGAFAPIAFVADAHHERIDGTGYHRGIGGAQLPRDARVLAVADVFDALHADRPYRAGLPIERVVDIIASDTGTAFDPDVVEALVWGIDEILDATSASDSGTPTPIDRASRAV